MPVLIVNGKEQIFADKDFPHTVACLIEHLGLEAQTVVAEVDGHIVPQAEFAAFSLQPGARVELVRFVGGG